MGSDFERPTSPSSEQELKSAAAACVNLFIFWSMTFLKTGRTLFGPSPSASSLRDVVFGLSFRQCRVGPVKAVSYYDERGASLMDFLK